MANTHIKRVDIRGGTSATGSDSIGGAEKFTRIKTGPGQRNPVPMVFRWKQEYLTKFSISGVKSYTLKKTPTTLDSISIFINGILQRIDIDFNIEDKLITFTPPPSQGSNIIAFYNASNK